MSEKVIIKERQTISDIATAIIAAIILNRKKVNVEKLPKLTSYEMARYIFAYCQNNFKYSAENGQLQTVKSLNRIEKDETNDCKHYTIYIACVLLALGYSVEIKFINQNIYAPNDWHVYPILIDKEKNENYILDVVYGKFNSEPFYQRSKSIIINNI